MNLNQTTTKIDETWWIASPLPCEHIPKRSRSKDQQILRIRGEIKKDWGFLKNSRTQRNQIPSQTGTKTRGLNRFKSPEGTRRIGHPFPIKSHTRSQQSMDKIYSKERNRGRGTQGRR